MERSKYCHLKATAVENVGTGPCEWDAQTPGSTARRAFKYAMRNLSRTLGLLNAVHALGPLRNAPQLLVNPLSLYRPTAQLQTHYEHD